MNTRAVTEELFRRIAGGDPAEIAELYAERVDWRLSWPASEHDSDIPWIRIPGDQGGRGGPLPHARRTSPAR